MRGNKLKGASVDSVLFVLIQVIIFGTNMLTTKLVSVSLSLTDYGTYSAANIILNLVTSFTLLGMGDCINYYFNNRTVCASEESRAKYVNTIFLTQAIIGIVAGLLLLLGRNAVSRYFNNTQLIGLVICFCFRPVIHNLFHLYHVLFVSVGRARLAAVGNLLLALARIILVLISLKLYHSLKLLFWGLAAIDAVQLISFGWVFNRKHFPVNLFKGSFKKVAEVLSFGLPMGIYFITNTLMREVDKLVVGRLGTEIDLAIYANCSKLLPVNLVVTSFATVLTPYIMRYISERKHEEVTTLFRNYIRIGYSSVWILSGALLICARQVLPFLYSDEYLQGFPIFVLYLLDGILQFANVHLIITANGETKYMMKISCLFLAVNAVSSVGLYYVFGLFHMPLLGPAVATVLITLSYNILILKKSSGILSRRIRAILPPKEWIPFALQLIATGGLLWFCKQILLAHGMHRYLVMILTCAAYCVVNAALQGKRIVASLKVINSYKLDQ